MARALGAGAPNRLAMTAAPVDPSNGGRPVSISKQVMASEYWSVRASTERSPVACSGAK